MNYNLEFIRFLAVILITFTHTKHDFTEGIFHTIIEIIPTYGTVILSIISGYLYWKYSKNKPNLIRKKFNNLIIPFLIANTLVLLPVLIFNFLGYNFLERYNYDLTMIYNGLFSINDYPINPPTYFIRDLFIVFLLVELILKRNLYTLIIILPLLFFGRLMNRYDIITLFVLGSTYAYFEEKINKKYLISLFSIVTILAFMYFEYYSKYPLSILVFLLLIDAKIKFFYTGGYTYLLHLYHAPIIVATLPFIKKFTSNLYLQVIYQIIVPFIMVYILFLFIKKVPKLKFLTGGR
ncbi:acyltransferase family protein [Aureivirga sp. CE67]|uniref:acyltransferase family protein n=1 Tax=Aureivirga sp. CE67 TaxID=1788983 RepID=UPI0018CB7D5A|nr:acyltransferase family protein [Aureivirga sp. CE67]